MSSSMRSSSLIYIRSSRSKSPGEMVARVSATASFFSSETFATAGSEINGLEFVAIPHDILRAIPLLSNFVSRSNCRVATRLWESISMALVSDARASLYLLSSS